MKVNGLLTVGLHAGLTLCIFMVINNEQPEPYMDEIFHIPQGRKFCYGNFKEVRKYLLRIILLVILYQ